MQEYRKHFEKLHVLKARLEQDANTVCWQKRYVLNKKRNLDPHRQSLQAWTLTYESYLNWR